MIHFVKYTRAILNSPFNFATKSRMIMRFALMKHALLLCLFGLANLLSAQSLEINYGSILTSNIWMEGGEHLMHILKFNADGTFFSTTQSSLMKELNDLDSMGKWEWLNQDTFTMQTTQKIINGQPKDLNPEPFHKRVIHIKRIDNKIIQGITHNILQSIDSEYAHEFEWKVKN